MLTYNRLECTKRTIDSLYSTAGYPFELYVFDNGSIDGTVEWIKQEKRITKYILSDTNIGIAKGLNTIWKLVPDYHFMKCDNDIIFNQFGWLKYANDAIENIPDLGITGVDVDSTVCLMKNETHNNILMNRDINDGSLCGATLIIPNRTQKELGYWCEEYDFYGEEDVDYCERVRFSGKKLLRLPVTKYNISLVGDKDIDYIEFKKNQRNNHLDRFWERYRGYKDKTISLRYDPK